MKWLVITAFFLAIQTHAAPAKVKPKELTDSDLLRAATSELEINSGSAASSGATVVADISSLEKDSAALPPADFSAGVMSHRPQGMGRISETESYPLNNLSARPMGVIKVNRWFREASRRSRGARWGAELQIGAGWNDLALRTSRGVTYDDVRLYSVLVSAGPAAELALPIWKGIGVGASPSIGRQFLVQSTAAPIANGSLQGNFWQAAIWLRTFVSDSIFIRLEADRRGIWGAQDDGLDIQKQSALALMGFSF